MSALKDQVSLAEIAALAEVGSSAVSNWRERYSDFPKGLRSPGQELFAAEDIARWLAGRKIPKNSLKANEDVGLTYRDRFLRNRGESDSGVINVVTTEIASREAKWERQIWAARDLLRDYYDAARSAELVLGLVYLKAAMPDQWRAIVDCSHDGESSRSLLRRAEFASNRGSSRIPLFLASEYGSMTNRSLAQLIHAIDVIDLGPSHGTSSVAAQVCDVLLANIARETGNRGGRFVPESLARCMTELVAPTQEDSVYDPFCGSGELFTAAAAQVERGGGNPNSMLISGQARTEWSWRMSAVNLALHGILDNIDIRLADALNDNWHPMRQFDVIMANPPFNLKNWVLPGLDDRQWLYGPPPESNANFAWLQHIASRLTHDGRAVVVMPNGAASTQHAVELSIRTRMVEAGVIDSVIALPGYLFRTTAISVSLWILKSPDDKVDAEVLFINATSMGAMADRTQRVLAVDDIDLICQAFHSWRDRQRSDAYEATMGFAGSAGREEIRANDYVLNPLMYVQSASPAVSPAQALNEIQDLGTQLRVLRRRSSEVQAMLDAKISSIAASDIPENTSLPGRRTIPLGEVCDVLAGPGTVDRSERQPSGTPLILPRNIRRNRIADVDLDSVDPQTAMKLARYRVSAGDVICPRTGTLGRYGLILERQNDWLLGPGCMRLRPKVKIDPSYLTYYLGSPSANGWLMANATGSAIRQINTQTLSRMPLALPSLAVQREIASVLDAFDADAGVDNQIGATRERMRVLLIALLIGDPTR